MELITYALVLVIAAPILAWSQGTSKPAGPEMKASFDEMQANVVKISEVSERERWQSNRDLWQAVIGQV